MIKLLIADDHELIRTAIRLMLQDATDMKIVGEAKSGEEAIQMAQRLKPDLVLMDLGMPGIGGFGAAVRLFQSELPIKVLIVSSQKDHIIPARLLQLGASGYLSKEAGADELKKAIRTIQAGNHYIDPFLMGQVLQGSEQSGNGSSRFASLSERELQILLMLAKGMDVKEIAQKLFLSAKTINGYHRDILRKLDVKSDVELTRLAIEHSLIDADTNWH